MLSRFVAAGADYGFEWPDEEEMAGANAAIRRRRQLERRRRNAASITQLDVATRAAFCSGPLGGSGIR